MQAKTIKVHIAGHFTIHWSEGISLLMTVHISLYTVDCTCVHSSLYTVDTTVRNILSDMLLLRCYCHKRHTLIEPQPSSENPHLLRCWRSSLLWWQLNIISNVAATLINSDCTFPLFCGIKNPFKNYFGSNFNSLSLRDAQLADMEHCPLRPCRDF